VGKMTASLAARRRREGEKPPLVVNKENDGKEQKEKKKVGEGWLKELMLMLAGLVWFSIIGLWKKPSNPDALKINLSLSKALYTPSRITIRVTLGAQTFGTSGNHKVISQDKRLRGEVRVVGQEGAHEEVEHAVRSAGGRAYFAAERIGLSTVAIDPDSPIQGLHW